MEVSLELEIITLCLSCLSFLSSIWITILYYKYSELHQHPSSLFSFISLFEIGISQHTIVLILDEMIKISEWGAYFLIKKLSFSWLSQSQVWGITCIINQSLFTGCVAAMICYNIIVCIDLIITVRNPLISGKSRMKYYHCATIFIVTIQIFCNIWHISSKTCKNDLQNYLNLIVNFGYMIWVFGVYIVTGLVSMVYTWVNLEGNILPCHNTAKKYFRRHLMYVTVFWLAWGSVITDYLGWIQGDWTQYLSFCLISSSGFLLALIRNFEKLFWERSKNLFCGKQEKNRKESSLEMWNKPISYILYNDIKTQATLCILRGIYYCLNMHQKSKENPEIFLIQ